MCTLVLSALPASIVLAYYAYKGQHFLVDLKKLEQDLMLVKTQERHQSQLMDQLKNAAGGNRGKWKYQHDQVCWFSNHEETEEGRCYEPCCLSSGALSALC